MLYDFKGKTVIVAGGCGLLGREISSQFRGLYAEVLTLDLDQSADLQVDLSHTLKVYWFLENHTPDIWVNCLYPKSTTDHFRIFLNLSEVISEHMAKTGGGAIVNISSIYGVIGGKPSMYEDIGVSYPPIGYSAAKGAIIAMSRALACKYGPHGVRVNCVSPGGVFDGQDPVFVERYNQRVPLGRIATPEDVADAVVFLASDKAKYITGQNLILDGGLTIQ